MSSPAPLTACKHYHSACSCSTALLREANVLKLCCSSLSWLNWKVKMSSGAVFFLLGCVLFTAGEEVVRLQELDGNTVTLHTGLTGVQSDAQILWFYGPEKSDIKIVNSQIIRGEDITEYYTDRFRDRLQLDRSSGSLTIRNINREDSGVYTLHIITGTDSVWRFSVKVYAPVSKPVIRTQAERRSSLPSGSCSPVCSVENRRDVTLSWYEDKEKISSISRADSSLHLPLNRTFPTNYTYTCMSANPVSNQSTQLNITQLCESAERGLSERNWIAVLIPVAVIGALLLLLLVIVVKVLPAVRKKKINQSVSEDKVLYAEVSTQKPKEAQKSKQEDNDDSVVYSSVRK